jgi:hypothetical protein
VRPRSPSTDTRSTSSFDPARDGFGFKNPSDPQKGRIDTLLYGRGLCFGMAAAALAAFSGLERRWPPPLAGLASTPELIREIRRYHALQFRPQVALRVGWNWTRTRGGRRDHVAGRIRIAGDSDPHILCLGPRAGRGFFGRFALAHAVAPYRLEEDREKLFAFVYDPEYPKDREMKIIFRRGSGGRFERFGYGGFDSREGWGITPVPLSALLPYAGFPE